MVWPVFWLKFSLKSFELGRLLILLRDLYMTWEILSLPQGKVVALTSNSGYS